MDENGQVIRVSTRKQLQEVARKLGVRPDWHEPDEQRVTATVSGDHLDNAGFWGDGRTLPGATEYYVTTYKDGEPVADVNLATLFAWACGYES